MEAEIVTTGIKELFQMERGGDPNRHISAIIRSLCVQLGQFEDDSDKIMSKEELEQRQTRWELGSAFEDAVVAALKRRYAKADPDRYCQPGEVEKDGLIGNLDLLDVTDWAIVEVKCSWMSSRHDIHSEKAWKFKVQVMAYAYMIETYRAYLHVAYLNGNYKDDRGPTCHIYGLTFTKQELHENWRLLKTESDAMVARARKRGHK